MVTVRFHHYGDIRAVVSAPHGPNVRKVSLMSKSRQVKRSKRESTPPAETGVTVSVPAPLAHSTGRRHATGIEHSFARTPIHADGPVGAAGEVVQRLPGDRAGASSPAGPARSSVRDVVGSGGRPLAADVRTEMEARLGHSFADVRVHTDARAETSAQEMRAHAYTVGPHIVFQRDRYDPGSPAGKKLLAHELTHVVQQRQGAVSGTPVGGGIALSHPSDRFEQAAAATAERAMAQPIQRSAHEEADQRRPAPAPQNLFVQRVVNGIINDQAFGDWLFALIRDSKENEGWEMSTNEDGSGIFLWTAEMMYKWTESQPGKPDPKAELNQFRSFRHLHLINKKNDVAIVFTYTADVKEDPSLVFGGSDKREKRLKADKKERLKSKDKDHSGGRKDPIQYNISQEIPKAIDDVPPELIALAISLRQLAIRSLRVLDPKYQSWLRDLG